MKAISRIALPFSFAFICVPSYAALVTTGAVTPAGLGPGDTVVTTGVAVGTGTLEINSGTSLTLNTNPFLTIAPVATDTGSVTVTGSNLGTPSTLRLEGATVNDGAFLTVGKNGNGTLNIINGAKVEIDALGASLNRMAAPYPAGFQVGRNAGSTGIINLSGAGSEMSVDSDFALGRIGRYGDGEMNITNGAILSFTGKNSDLNVSSDVHVPNSGNGVLNINTGGRVVGPVYLDVGGSQGGEGIVNLDGSSSSISLSGACTPDCPAGYSYPNQGAFLTVGANEGKGTVNITNGAKLTIDSSVTSGAINAGFGLGGSSIIGPIGNGTLNVDGAGSELRVRGGESTFVVGRLENGTGALSITNGGKVIMENTDGQSTGYVGDRADAEGLITIDGAGSLLDAGFRLGIGVDQTLTSAGDGHVVLKNGGTLLADEIYIENGGTIGGNGTLAGSTGSTQVRVATGGSIAPGLSPGELVIDGDLILDGGSLVLEAFSATVMDKITVTGDAIFTAGVLDIILGFTPGPSDILNFFDVDGTVLFGTDFGGINLYSAPGSGVPLGTEVTALVGSRQFTATTQSVPEPITLALMGFGLALIGCRRKAFKAA